MEHSSSYTFSKGKRKRLIDLIPEVGDIDPHKENIQPRRKGRSVAALTTLFDRTASERQKDLEEGHLHFQQLIDQIDEEDDPLQIYVDYIRWTLEMYPEGQIVDSNLIGLLKEATDNFITDKRYKNDSRYLKIWLEYAELISDPKDIFLHLIRHGVCQSLALFYEEYSAYYEKLNKIDEATQVFELGIEQRAEPLKRLERNFALFKARVQAREEKGLISKRTYMEARIQMESLRATGHRIMLGQKSDSNSQISTPSNIYAGHNQQGSSSTRNRSFGHSSYRSTAESSSSSSPFSVYVDTEPTRPSILPSSSPSSESPSLRVTESAFIRRENQRPVEKFAGATLPQVSTKSQRPVERFEVYQDPTLAAETDTTSSTSCSTTADVPMLSISTSEESALSKIRRNPISDVQIKRKTTASETEIDGLLRCRFDRCHKDYLRSSNSKGETELIAVASYVYGDGSSFEEYRASQLKYASQVSDSRMKQSRKDKNRSFDNVENSVERTGFKYNDALDEFERYNQSLMEDAPPQEYTTETLAAMNSINALYRKHIDTEDGNDDLTWNNIVQKFPKNKRPPVNENE
ncbi:MAG: Mad3/BUB1 homology region 1-domain-containing protein [Benjaminiella poitrasii]|nr:MAG: Mad3/BUB1 homology region 1-domain-containing protein [Benjaminiella poitrasii]